MASYRRFFGLQVEHEYTAPEGCYALHVQPDAATGAHFARAGILLRTEPDGIQTYWDGENESVLRGWLQDAADPFRMVFRITARNPDFFRYTEFAEERVGRIHLLDTEEHAPTEPLRLEREDGTHPSEAEGVIAGVADRRDERIPPLAILVVRPRPTVLDAPGPDPYRLVFDARRTRWRYHLLGTLAEREALHINDAGGGAETAADFENQGRVELPNGRVARLFMSATPLTTQRRTNRRLQLREGEPGNGRILVRRLPVASPESLSMATVDGRRTLVSDIYVYS